MDWLYKILEYTKMEDWYDISVNIINKNDGNGLLHKYNGSYFQLLKAVYPDFEWIEWKFNSGVPPNFWKDKKNHKIYMDWLYKILGYTKMEDLYGISVNIITENDGAGLLQKYNG